MRTFFVAALLAASFAAPAMAQDGSPFTGLRVEGIAGWDRPSAKDAGHDDGVAYGVGVGYDMQLGGAVVGIEGEASDATTSRCAKGVTVPADKLCFKAKRDLYVGGRVGGVIANNTLLYAKAGYSNARFGLEYDDGGSGAADFSNGGNLDGYRVGAGIERKLASNTYLKAEYRYSNYEHGFDRSQVVGGVGVRF